VLEPFAGKWHSDSFLLEGEVDTTRFLSWVHIFRDGALVDSVTTTLDSLFTVRVSLEPGENSFSAVLFDSARVQSPPSNTVTIFFDTSAGFFVPVPFGPGATFDLNAVSDALGADVRVFDVAGDFVVRFESREAQTFYASGERVHRGPLVAVGTIDYPDGSHKVVRRVFLYDPEAPP
jgi:hypothetical protein